MIYNSIDQMWLDGVQELLSRDSTGSRVGEMRECVAYSATLVDINNNWLRNPRRDLSKAYGSAELLWYLSGTNDASLVLAYAPQYKNFLDDGITAYGAYGKRWSAQNQLKNLHTLLREQPETRQGMLSCWRAEDLKTATQRASRDLPCTVALQFLVRREELCVIATMRSNDAWLGMPYDIWCFTSLQRLMADALELDYGPYIHQVGSMHLYERNVDAAREAVEQFDFDTQLSPRPALPSHATCWDDVEMWVRRALDTEEKIRKGSLKESERAHMSNLLRDGSFFKELVECCAEKQWSKTG